MEQQPERLEGQEEDLPDAHFGQVGAEPSNWREAEPDDDLDPDDEVLAETPPDVVEMLGFDPMEKADDVS